MDKKKIQEFYKEFFNGQNLAYAETIVSENYIQHNPSVEQGREGLVKAFREKFASGEYFHVKIDQIVFETPYVAVFLRSVTPEGKTRARVVDLYRFENDTLVEHWDVFDGGN